MPLPLKHLTVLLLSLICITAQAAPAHARNDKLKPKGPVTVTADRAELDKAGAMIYLGNVMLVSDNLQLKGDRLELKQYPGDQYEAKVSGTLAHMEHGGETDDKGQPLPPMIADGETLNYDTRTGLLDIIGKAKATRGKNEVNGNTIHYNVNERRVQVNGGDGKQVRIIFQPGEKLNSSKSPSAKSKTAEKKPAPAAAPAQPSSAQTAPASAVVAPAPSETASAPKSQTP